jgi:hypothetical protein
MTKKGGNDRGRGLSSGGIARGGGALDDKRESIKRGEVSLKIRKSTSRHFKQSLPPFVKKKKGTAFLYHI